MDRNGCILRLPYLADTVFNLESNVKSEITLLNENDKTARNIKVGRNLKTSRPYGF